MASLSDSYPLPSYAAYIWLKGDQVCLSFPGQNGARAHQVQLPLNEAGLKCLVDILKGREQNEVWLARAGAPTKRQVEEDLKKDAQYNAWLKAMRTSQKEKDEATKFLEELGL